jgi:uncharacterized membrane-anchored protein
MIYKFFYLEGAYLILAAMILLVTLFVTTRPFMSKNAPKKGLISVGMVLGIAIGLHFYFTYTRMEAVKEAFKSGKTVLCESRMFRSMAQSIKINKKLGEWELRGDEFVSPHYIRPFYTARCIVED